MPAHRTPGGWTDQKRDRERHMHLAAPGERPPEPTLVELEPPEYLSSEQRGLWEEFAHALGPKGSRILRRVDAPALEALVVAVDLHRRLTRRLARAPVEVKGSRDQRRPNPLIREQREQAKAIRMLAERFGFDPLTRHRAGMQAPEDVQLLQDPPDAAAGEDASGEAQQGELGTSPRAR